MVYSSGDSGGDFARNFEEIRRIGESFYPLQKIYLKIFFIAGKHFADLVVT